METDTRLAHIPSELTERPQWVCWKRELRRGKLTKVPHVAAAGHRHADSTDPATWRTFEEACEHAGRFDGIGFVFAADDPYCGIDLDHAISTDTGEVHPDALEVLRDFPSYTEQSPSGTGLHILCRATLAGTGTKKPRGSIDVEMYDRGRYFTVTGARWADSPASVADCQTAAANLYAELKSADRKTQPAPRRAEPLTLTDQELLERARNAKNGASFAALFDHGDTTGYAGASEADRALCAKLNFWTGNSPDHTERLARQSALCRPKWDERRGDTTWIRREVEGTYQSEIYNPNPRIKIRINGQTPVPGAGQPEEDDSMEALTQARETIAAAIEARTASAVLDNPEVLKALAALPPGERTDSQQAIKKAIPQIGLRQLRAAIPSAKNAGNGAGRPHGDDSTEAQTQVNDTKVDSEARDNIRLRHFPLSDAGNAEMFATIYGHNVRYMHGLDRWLVWRGHWWQPDTNGELFRLAKGCARVRFQLTWDQIQDEKGRKASAAHAIRSEQGSGIAAMLKLARAEHPITVGSDEADQWDSDPWLIAVANGVVDLRTGDLRAGKREDRVTMNLPFRYDPEAACPRWAQFIAEVMDGDPEMVAYLQRQVGYSLTGLTSEQVWWLLYGKGANGKSVFLETLADAFAPLAFTTPFATFERQRSGGIPNDLAALAGRRLVMASETNENAKLNEARIKGVVHGGPQTARFLNKEFFTFNSQVKLWLGVNHKPQVDDNSKGFWRSVHMVPFTRTFEGAAADPHLKDKLMIEAPGILAWAVRGCLEWQRVGLNPPAIVTAATAEYRREADQMSEFIADACETGPGCQVQAGELAKAYGRWAEAQGMHERDKDRLTATTLGRRMADREGVSKKHGKRGTIYHGIGLKSDGLEGSDVD